MRYLIASLLLCCCFVNGYSQEETPAEVTVTDEGGNEDVAVHVESHNNNGDKGGGCGCGGKPKI